MKFRERKLNRLSGYDYSTPGYYFVTICTKYNECLFGEIVNDKMELNEMGKITDCQKLFVDSKHFRPDVLMKQNQFLNSNGINPIMIESSEMKGNYIEFRNTFQIIQKIGIGIRKINHPIGNANQNIDADIGK